LCVPINISRIIIQSIRKQKAIQNGTGKYITIINVHTVVEAVQNPDYKKAIVNSSFAIADGRPLIPFMQNGKV
jgi:UDP-N-acetyl-D-mannosaminuronic acid transferase (WecB/TagA/CpsF family)